MKPLYRLSVEGVITDRKKRAHEWENHGTSDVHFILRAKRGGGQGKGG